MTIPEQAIEQDILRTLRHGHAEPIADEHYRLAAAEIERLRAALSKAIDDLSYADLRASGGIEGAALVGVKRAQIEHAIDHFEPSFIADLSVRVADNMRHEILTMVRALPPAGVQRWEDVARAVKDALKVTSEHDHRPWSQIEAAILALPHTGQQEGASLVTERDMQDAKELGERSGIEMDDWDEFMHDIAQAIANGRRLSLAPAPASPRAEGEWQPIETAPKDGRYIQTFTPSRTPQQAIMFWWKDKWVEGDMDWYVKGPTHWKPLPAPPLVAEKQTGER